MIISYSHFFYNLKKIKFHSLLTVWYALRPSQQPTKLFPVHQNNHWTIRRLKNISTPDFSTPIFNPRPFNTRLFNREFLNHGVKKFMVEKSGVEMTFNLLERWYFNPGLFNHKPNNASDVSYILCWPKFNFFWIFYTLWIRRNNSNSKKKERCNL